MALLLQKDPKTFSFAVLLGFTSLGAQAGPVTTAGPRFARVDGLTYSRGEVGPLLADMYLPNGSGLHPAIVFVHGGGWIGSSRTGWSELIAPFAEQGYLGMAVDYDLSPAVRFPTALEECKEAVRWLRAHAREYHIDPNRIAIAGGSAGGELAALVALTSNDARYDRRGSFRELSSSVKAAVLYSSDLDLTKFSNADHSIMAYLGGSCTDKPELCRQASPQFHLSGALPPIFIGHGDADEDVPFSQFTSFVQAYKKANGPIMTFVAKQGPHAYAAMPQWRKENADAVLRFLKRYL